MSASMPETAAAEVDSLRRGLDVLRLFTAERGRIDLSAIARELGLARPTAARLVRTLADEGFLRVVDDGATWAAGTSCLALGNAWRAGQRSLRGLRDALARAATDLDVELVVATLQGADALCVHRTGAAADRWPSGSRRALLAAGAPGQALLWALPAPRQARLIERLRSQVPAGGGTVATVYRGFQQLEEHGACIDASSATVAVPLASVDAEPEAPMVAGALAPPATPAARLDAIAARLLDASRALRA